MPSRRVKNLKQGLNRNLNRSIDRAYSRQSDPKKANRLGRKMAAQSLRDARKRLGSKKLRKALKKKA